ncbi:MAG TPA: hypothetical protein VHZ52_00555 [Acidobacteriaceae bacterium]|nr:hypothetical protein [Acidobacteriaceae bacterium]
MQRSFLLPVLAAAFAAGMSASAQAQASSSASAPEAPAPQTQPAPQTTGPLTVQARLKARREQRRIQAIHDVYSHLYEIYVGAGYLRFFPGNGIPPQDGERQRGLQRMNEYAWNVGVTRYFNERLGVTIDGRGTYGSAYVGNNPNVNAGIPKPAISQYAAMGGPTYRFLLKPKYSISGRVLAGGAWGNFSGDLGPSTPANLGLWPDGASVAISASIPFEYNFSPAIGFRVAPEYVLTNFGSTIQNNRGFTGGVVVRWGKQ